MRQKKWGRFVGISSNMVGLAMTGMSHYIASKMGIIGFMRGLANDVANDGITANAVLSGLTNTLAIASREQSGWQPKRPALIPEILKSPAQLLRGVNSGMLIHQTLGQL